MWNPLQDIQKLRQGTFFLFQVPLFNLECKIVPMDWAGIPSSHFSLVPFGMLWWGSLNFEANIIFKKIQVANIIYRI